MYVHIPQQIVPSLSHCVTFSVTVTFDSLSYWSIVKPCDDVNHNSFNNFNWVLYKQAKRMMSRICFLCFLPMYSKKEISPQLFPARPFQATRHTRSQTNDYCKSYYMKTSFNLVTLPILLALVGSTEARLGAQGARPFSNPNALDENENFVRVMVGFKNDNGRGAAKRVTGRKWMREMKNSRVATMLIPRVSFESLQTNPNIE
jgi:hypothetical protein